MGDNKTASKMAMKTLSDVLGKAGKPKSIKLKVKFKDGEKKK